MYRSLLVSLSVVCLAISCLSALATESIPLVSGTAERTLDKTLSQHELQQRFGALDCSHLVHALYESLGLHYFYATSRSLYIGIPPFKRVDRPDVGDLVVWRGHVGIVVDPAQHRFLSALRSGVRIASYASNYWQKRGRPRFFRHPLLDGVGKNQTEVDSTIAGESQTTSQKLPLSRSSFR